VAGLGAALPELDRRGAGLVVVGSARPEAIPAFCTVTGFAGRVLVDPSLATFRAAGLTHGLWHLADPRGWLSSGRALARGMRPGAIRGNVSQQGGTFAFGPGNAVLFEWRDRFSGDHPAIRRVLEALD
jgi:hypothetical protein